MQIVSFSMLTVGGIADILAAEHNVVLRVAGIVVAAAAIVMVVLSIRRYRRERAGGA